MNKMYRQTACMTLVLMMILLSACQNNPLEHAVTSKNDGAFDANVILSASENHDPNATQDATYSEIFYSADNSVLFKMCIDETVSAANMPVIEVEPYYLTGKDAQNVAAALFGNVNFYEQEPRLEPTYSKTDIQKKLIRWAQYTNTDAIKELYGQSRSDIVELVQNVIAEYTAMLETAPDKNLHTPCEWTFKADSYYWWSEEKVSQMDTSDDNLEISAEVEIDGATYLFTVTKRDREDFRISNISVYLYHGMSPDAIDERIYKAQMCRTNEPTDLQMAAVREKVDTILDQMCLGDWMVDELYVETKYYGDIPEYYICVNAVPVLNGVAAIRQQQLSAMRDADEFAANMYLTDACFKFSANGDLIAFDLQTPLQVKEVLNENVAVMSLDELIEKAKSHLELSDRYEYGMSAKTLNTYDKNGLELDCTVTISELSYNLTRVKVPDTDDSYYYVPGITLKGNIEYTDPSSGEVYFENNGVTLVAVNGVDGTIISTTNE